MKCWDLPRCNWRLKLSLMMIVFSSLSQIVPEKDLAMKIGMLPENEGSGSPRFFEAMQITEVNARVK